MKSLRRAFDAILANVLIWMLITLLAVMSVQILLRYGFSTSLIWAEEVCRYLLVWVSFLAAILAYERGEIATVTMLRDSLPRVPALILSIIANICGVVLLLVLVRYGYLYAERMGSAPIPALQFILEDIAGPGTPAPRMFWVYVALPLGLGIFAVRLAVDVLHYARMIVTPGAEARDLHARPEAEGH